VGFLARPLRPRRRPPLRPRGERGERGCPGSLARSALHYQPTKCPTEFGHITSGDESYQKLLNRRPHVFTNDIAAT